MTPALPSLEQVVAMLAMARHPLAGWYAPHYADGETAGPSRLSSRYVLLSGDEPLPLHKLVGIEVWHYHLGAPAEMVVSNGNGSRLREVSRLGPDLAAGERPQLAMPAHVWHACRSLGAWTLLGCTQAPGHTPRGAFALNVGD